MRLCFAVILTTTTPLHLMELKAEELKLSPRGRQTVPCEQKSLFEGAWLSPSDSHMLHSALLEMRETVLQ